jgi:hypothetical protein
MLALSSALTQEEEDELSVRPPHPYDFITARQVRNLTVSGDKELAPIYGRYFRKPLVELLQSTQPRALQLRSMYFRSFDGLIIKEEARDGAVREHRYL